MSSSHVPAPQQLAELSQKLYNVDPDIRYMSLHDLTTVLNSNSTSYLSQDYHQCARITDGLLHTLNDTNGEVQNETIKCLGPFVLRCDPGILCPLIHKVGTQSLDKTVDNTITAMALRAIVTSLPRPSLNLQRNNNVQNAYSAISRVLIPRLVGRIVLKRAEEGLPSPPKGLLQEDLEKGGDGNSMEVLIEVAKCFGSMLHQAEIQALEEISLKLLESPKSSSILKKKAVNAIAVLAQFFSENLLTNIMNMLIEKLRNVHLMPSNRKLYFSLLGSITRAVPAKIGPRLKVMAPFVIAALSQQEVDDQAADDAEDGRDPQVDEVREAALTALEAFYTCCPHEMTRFNKESLDSFLRFLRYDPNVVEDDEMQSDEGAEEDDEFDGDEDFEQEDIADDEDDVSWKVRRCAAKALQSVVTVKSREFLDNDDSYNRITKSLVDRFKEREESVRIEVVQTTSVIVRKSMQEDFNFESLSISDHEHAASQQSGSKKRRRADSNVDQSDSAKYRRLTGSVSPVPQSSLPSGAPANLAKATPEIVRGCLKLALGSTPATKLVAVVLLKDVLIARQGGVGLSLKEVMGLIKANVGSPVGASLQMASMASGSLHIESLRLLSEVAKTTSSNKLQPFIRDLVPTIRNAVEGRSTQVSCEGLKAVEQLVKVLTPPRGGSTLDQSPAVLKDILQLLTSVISSKKSDLLVRQQAITALGTLLGRTLSKDGAQLVSQEQREPSLQIIYDSIQNETTRYATIKAVDAMAAQAPDGVIFPKSWFTNLCTELGNQLRKMDRSLRGASLQALRILIAERHGSKNLNNPEELAGMLTPLLISEDLHLIGPALLTLGALVRDGSVKVLSKDLITSVVKLLQSTGSTSVADQLTFFVDCVGERKAGKELMQALLKDVGLSGNSNVVGKIIGDLLTSSNGSAGIDINAFQQELKSSKDERRQCLALSVIGEYGLRSGQASGLDPNLFVAYLDAKNSTREVSLAAAIALGRTAASSGNVKAYLPQLLSRANAKSDQQNIALHGIKEVLQYNDDVNELAPFLQKMWDASLTSASDENARSIGAECLANIAELEPKVYLQSLQVSVLLRTVLGAV